MFAWGSFDLPPLRQPPEARRFYAKAGGAEGPKQGGDLFGTPVRGHPVLWEGAGLERFAEFLKGIRAGKL